MPAQNYPPEPGETEKPSAVVVSKQLNNEINMAKKKSKKAKPIITDDTITPVYVTQYEITEEPIQEPSFRRLPKPIKERLENLYEVAQRQPQQAIPELIELQKQYPNVPQIYNYLAVAYSHTGEKGKAELITQENIRKNPDYLFARINQAQFLLAKKEYDKIPEVFEHKYDLQMLYPRRRKFHISEVANFMGIMGLYFARIGERETAEKYNEILQEIASEFPIAKSLNRELHPSITTRVVKRLLGE
jgi:tetratricopeptide (TPR) repeat protein